MNARVVVLSAPSGGGKTTISKVLLERFPQQFGYSVSATTRAPRPGEQDGQAYHFLSRAEFERRRAAGEFLEWAQYAGELYGTLQSEVERVLRSGRHVVLDIEVQGARQVRAAYPRSVSVCIFLVPPSARVLVERLRNRQTESEQELSRRIRIAVDEINIAQADLRGAAVYDHVVVNDDLERAVARVLEIVSHPGAAAQETADMTRRLGQFARDLETEVRRLQLEENR